MLRSWPLYLFMANLYMCIRTDSVRNFPTSETYDITAILLYIPYLTSPILFAESTPVLGTQLSFLLFSKLILFRTLRIRAFSCPLQFDSADYSKKAITQRLFDSARNVQTFVELRSNLLASV